MGLQRDVFIILGMIIVSISVLEGTMGLRYTVGDSVWSIPIYPDFYSIWSSSILFYLGDSLVFEFESEFSNVIQVTRLDYDSCTTWGAMKILTVSPSIVILNEEGVFYYISNVSNYCDLGQKITIVVHERPTPTPSPSLLPAPLPQVPAPSNAKGGLHYPVAVPPVILNGNNNDTSCCSAANRMRLGFVYTLIIFGWAFTLFL